MLQQNLDSLGPISTPNAIKRRFNCVLARFTIWSILYDLTDFLWVGTRTDSVILAAITSVPAFIRALLWSGVSLSVVYLAANRPVTTHGARAVGPARSVTSHFVGFCSILLSQTAVSGTATLSGGVTSCFREAVKPPIEDPSIPISLRSASMIGAWAL